MKEEPLVDTVIAAIEVVTQDDFRHNVAKLPTTAETIRQETAKDTVLKTAMKFVNEGLWPTTTREDPTYPLYARREGLSIMNECLMMADRVVIPSTLRGKVLTLLHEGHPGISKMKALARSYVYWPNIDADIERIVRQCESCQLAGKAPLKVPMESFNTGPPWSRVHADLAGPMKGQYFLVVVDSTSKWPEVEILRRITSAAVIEAFTEIFSRFGNPECLVTDNGGQFTSADLKNFCQTRGIRQIFSAPYHPQSNGQAERYVDTVKRALKKLEGEGTVTQNLQRFLTTYRNTPSPALPDGKTPAEVLLGRKPRTTLDLLVPTKHNPIENPSAYKKRMKRDFDRHHGARARNYEPEDWVYASFHDQNKHTWKSGIIRSKIGSNMYEVRVGTNSHTRHANQLKPRYSEPQTTHSWEDFGLQLAMTLPCPTEDTNDEHRMPAVENHIDIHGDMPNTGEDRPSEADLAEQDDTESHHVESMSILLTDDPDITEISQRLEAVPPSPGLLHSGREVPLGRPLPG